LGVRRQKRRENGGKRRRQEDGICRDASMSNKNAETAFITPFS